MPYDLVRLLAIATLAFGLAAGSLPARAQRGPPIPAAASVAPAAPAAAIVPAHAAVFRTADRSVSTWRAEAAAHLDLAPDAVGDLAAGRESTPVARCVKLNNYWCIKKAGWAGEISADGDGHVAFSSAAEGAAVAALLLKRYYVDFNRRTALAIIARWAPAQCGLEAGGLVGQRLVGSKTLAPAGIRSTLRARWLATHARGFVTPVAGAGKAKPRRSVVADHVSKMMPAPAIAVGLGERPMTPMTLDALLQNDAAAPPSRSMLGSPSRPRGGEPSCAGSATRITAYAAKAAAGIVTGPDGDLGLFDAAGAPTANLATMMANMARVEIGPNAVREALIRTGIAEAFRPGRNPS